MGAPLGAGDDDDRAPEEAIGTAGVAGTIITVPGGAAREPTMPFPITTDQPSGLSPATADR